MANQRRGTLSFDLSSPLKMGTLLKQGQFHRAFKFRFFVLYPGFLVYYEDQSKWKLDLTRGDTLQSRQGAIKLKNGSASIARQPPKGCKFGLIIHAPDPQNKRPTYLLNAASKEDRDAWIEALKKGTPHSPKAGKKDVVKPKENSKKKEDLPPPPKYTQRQETCDVAAVIAAEAEESNPQEQSITSIDQELLEEPSLSVRRDTSNTAALSLANNETNTSLDQVLEESEPVTSIDDVLGVADSDNSSEDGSHGDDLANGHDLETEEKQLANGDITKPDSEDQKEDVPQNSETEQPQDDSELMDTNEKVLSSMNSRGNIEVVTSVTVACVSNGDCSETGGNKRGEENETPAENGETKKELENDIKAEDTPSDDTSVIQNGIHKDSVSSIASSSHSSEVIVTAEEPTNNSFSVTVATMADDEEDSDEDGDGSSLSSPPPTDLQKNGSVSSGRPSECDSSASEPTTPSIVVETVGSVKQNGAENSSGDEGPKLSPPINRARRGSAPFIQKVGYLYKMGGNRKNWKLRYFVVNPGVFFYYKNPKSTKPLGEVKLKSTKIFFPASGERKTSYQFVIHTESQWNKRQDWVFAAQSEREMKEWISAFKLASQKPGSPTGSDEEDIIETM